MAESSFPLPNFMRGSSQIYWDALTELDRRLKKLETGGVDIEMVTPNSGPTEGGTNISVIGHSFVSGGVDSVTIGDGGEETVCTEVNVIDDNLIQATTGFTFSEGPMPVKVKKGQQTQATLVDGFTYTNEQPPT